MAIAICTKAHASAEQNHGTRQLEAILNKGGTRMIAGIVLRAGVSAGVYFASGVLCALIFGCTSSQDDQHDTVPTVTFACNEVTMELELTTGQAQRILGIISRQPYESRLQEGEMKPGAFPYATFVVGGQRDYDWHMHMLWYYPDKETIHMWSDPVLGEMHKRYVESLRQDIDKMRPEDIREMLQYLDGG